MIKLKPKQSQLDYLWTTYGNFDISNTLSSEDSLVTASAIVDYVLSELKKLNTDINLELTDSDNVITLKIKDHQNVVLSLVKFDKGSRITNFRKFISTQEDVDKGHSEKVGCLCLALQDSLGQEYYVDLTELEYSGSETDSIVTAVNNNKVASTLKIDNPILDKSVDIVTTPQGVRASLVIDQESNSSIVIEKGDKGISCHYKWEGENTDLKFKALAYNEYLLLKPNNGTLYFITDLPCIYFRGNKYASSTELMDYMTKDEAKEFFEEQNSLLIKKIEDQNSKILELKSYVDSDRDRIAKLEIVTNNVVASIEKLNGDESVLGSVSNIVSTKIKDSLSWENI